MAPNHVGDTKGASAPTTPAPHDEDDGDIAPEVEKPAQTTQADPNEPKQDKLLRIAHHTKKGFVPYNQDKVNQDRYLVRHTLQNDPGLSIFGVFDGHGEFGHTVAEFVKVNLPVYLEQLPLRDSPAECICYAVSSLASALQESSISIAFSGTTAVFALKVDDVLYVANIGDSRCILARYAQGEQNVLEAVPLSNDHKPSVPEEKARILAHGGRVGPLPSVEGDTDTDQGPDRVWLADYDIPGLAMSRSIGDEVSQRVGVISVPEIISYTITSSDLFAIFASDGVWEFVSNEQAVLEVYSHLPDLADSTRSLVSLSTMQWKQNEQVIDDITVVIAQFNYEHKDETQ